ncbi:helix-turn-helix transcriptional regulator [Reichenbachiella carrageenanivorans]|uniref:Helix-turn-helix transcriptional regulator n=1 Tax=Reichenbachiella carrageenanivorans TaxID=2979869 RepID=A0ABY6D1T9_9BACT|nr:AraC family transcriptional regulator [Reichenbachiella carrageenanivorans]UXX79699.1 helix-turn-helix transcriptional regulator [Reichenbachiella carrageenanivorans]
MELIEKENLIFKAGDTGIFLGKIKDNAQHQHYALQLTIAVNDAFELTSEEGKRVAQSVVVHPQVPHQLDSRDQQVLVILFNPASAVGHFLHKHQTSQPVEEYDEEWIGYLRMFAQDLLKNEINEKTFLSACINSMAEYNVRCLSAKHEVDKRILATLQYLDRHTRSVVSLEEMAEEMCLSESRFQHLFKEHTGLSYRRMQLWKRLVASFDQAKSVKTLTELAHLSGFSDSAHYSKTFKESFGLRPSELFGNSQLILD